MCDYTSEEIEEVYRQRREYAGKKMRYFAECPQCFAQEHKGSAPCVVCEGTRLVDANKNDMVFMPIPLIELLAGDSANPILVPDEYLPKSNKS